MLGEIINDGEDMDVTSPPAFAVKQNSSPAILRAIPQKLSKPSAEVRSEVFPSELTTPTSEVVAAVFQEEPSFEVQESSPKTKGDIVGYSDGEDDEHSDKASTDNSSGEESKDEDVESKDEIKLLPATVDGLGKRLRKLLKEFMREEKHEHRNDELLRQDAITRDECKQLNTVLAESVDEEMDIGSPAEEEDELKKVIHATTHNVIESDKKELMELLAELKEEVTENYIDDVLQLEKLIDEFLTDDYLEGRPLIAMIDETLDGFSTIPNSKQRRLKMLIGDIRQS